MDPGFDSLGGVGVFRFSFDLGSIPVGSKLGLGLTLGSIPPSNDAGFDPLGTRVRLGQGSIPQVWVDTGFYSLRSKRGSIYLRSLWGAIHPSLAVGSNPSGSWVRSRTQTGFLGDAYLNVSHNDS